MALASILFIAVCCEGPVEVARDVAYEVRGPAAGPQTGNCVEQHTS